MTALGIPLTPLIEAAALWRPPKGSELASAAVATLGTFLLTRSPDAAGPAGPGGGDGPAPAAGAAPVASTSAGDLLSVACALFFALHVLALNRFAGARPGAAPTVAVGQVAVTALLAALSCGVLEAPAVRDVTLYVVVAMLFLSAVATAGGLAAFTWAQGRMSATRSMVICATEPLFAALSSFLWLGEALGRVPMLGAFLIALSVVMPELRAHLPPLPGWAPPALAPAWEAVRRAVAPAVPVAADAEAAAAATERGLAAAPAREMGGRGAGREDGAREEGCEEGGGERVGLLAAKGA